MRHPPFSTEPASPGPDFCSQEGAHALARRIRNAWRAVGYDIEPQIERVGSDGMARPVYGVRLPDLIGGLAPPWRRIEP